MGLESAEPHLAGRLRASKCKRPVREAQEPAKQARGFSNATADRKVGRPKVVTGSHGGLIFNQPKIGVGRRDLYSHCVPVFHRLFPRSLGFLLLSCFPVAGLAHWSSDSQIDILVTNGAVRIEWAILMRDLDPPLGLDENGDGNFPDSEWQKKSEAMLVHASSHLGVRVDGTVGALEPGPIRSKDLLDGVYAIFTFTISRVGEPETLELDYRLHEGLDPHHRGLVRVSAGGRVQTAVLDRIEPQQLFVLASPSAWGQFSDFARKGVLHIWAGLDHMLFLLALLMPSVLRWTGNQWEPVTTLKPAVWNIVRLVTAFTVAHSLTLTLAVLGWAVPPSRPVETLIALSVAVAAANNLRPRWAEQNWVIAFVFGLVHGFGFSSALTGLGLTSTSIAWPLAGFNAGVEIGQLACVALFLPVAGVLRRKPFYARIILRGGSALILVLALAWAAERVFGAKWMPF